MTRRRWYSPGIRWRKWLKTRNLRISSLNLSNPCLPEMPPPLCLMEMQNLLCLTEMPNHLCPAGTLRSPLRPGKRGRILMKIRK